LISFENTQGFDSVYWKIGNDVLIKNENEIVLPKGVYSLYGTDKNNCVLYSTFTVTDGFGEIKVPNIFTPNADGINDEFRLIEYACIQDFRIRIFNRWGKQVFESNSKDFIWNGSSSPDGIYYYDIILTNSSNEEQKLKGWIQISR